MSNADKTLHLPYQKLKIHGDNVVECTRTLQLILRALAVPDLTVSGPDTAATCPCYYIHTNTMDDSLSVTFLPGFGRWDTDILEVVRTRGGILREAPDVILTGVTNSEEIPLLAIEFCGALPAGNQAWQRNGRAYSFGRAGISYLYITELGGYELDQNRNRKAPRMPNPAVPFSYVTYSKDRQTPVYPIFVTSPGADSDSRELHADEFADDELLSVVRAILQGLSHDHVFEELEQKVLAFIRKRAQVTARQGRSLPPEAWDRAYEYVREGHSLVDYLADNTALPWSKTAYIDALTDRARDVMALAKHFAVGLTAPDLPLCIIRQPDRQAFATRLIDLYANLPKEFTQWLRRDSNLTICWIMGFKPRGDDARPDRGLAPLARMLIGKDEDLLTIVYGPAPPATWPQLNQDPRQLMRTNGLWEAILEVSDALLVESATDQYTDHGFEQAHWAYNAPAPRINPFLVTPKPHQVGEHDVDTVLHILFADVGGGDVFEGMCNPPGGDWSGVSLLPPDRTVELRWLSLPRVSGQDTKRPDHIFQFFDLVDAPIILCVESKERARSLESRIGPRLIAYVQSLLRSPASIEREQSTDGWRHSARQVAERQFYMASAAAFVGSDASQLSTVKEQSQADLLFAFTFHPDHMGCDVTVTPNSKIGRVLAAYIDTLDVGGLPVQLVRSG